MQVGESMLEETTIVQELKRGVRRKASGEGGTSPGGMITR